MVTEHVRERKRRKKTEIKTNRATWRFKVIKIKGDEEGRHITLTLKRQIYKNNKKSHILCFGRNV